MNEVKKLAGQTIIYGLGSILPRVLNYLILTVFYSRIFKLGEYGIVSELYAYLVVLLVIIEFGMESGFFRHAGKEGDFRKVYSHALGFVILLSVAWLVFIFVFTRPVAELIRYSSNPEYIRWFAWIIALDAISSIPYAKIRQQERPMRFALLRLLNVIINVILVFLFLLVFPWLHEKTGGLPAWLYNPDIGVGYVFISNLATSAFMMILLVPELRDVRPGFDARLMKKLFVFSAPLMIVGVAGAINDQGDKIILKYLLPGQATAIDLVGEYSASNRIAVIMMLFIQMFRYAFEPFLFTVSGDKDAPRTYADVMKYFVIMGLLIFLGTTLYIDVVQILLDRNFRGGLGIVPHILLGYLFLGVYYNLSVWYKIKDLTVFAAVMAIIGSIITLFLNWLLIPRIGYEGSAWAKLLCYLSMMIISYFWGLKYYRIPYQTGRMILWTVAAVALYLVSAWLRPEELALRLLFNTSLFGLFIVIVGFAEKKMVKTMITAISNRFKK